MRVDGFFYCIPLAESKDRRHSHLDTLHDAGCQGVGGAVSNSSSTTAWLNGNEHHPHLDTFGRAGATPVALKALVIAVVPAGVRVSVTGCRLLLLPHWLSTRSIIHTFTPATTAGVKV